MALSIGEQLWLEGRIGTVVALTATTDADGRGALTYGGNTFAFRVVKCAPLGDGTEFPYVATDDPYFRVGLARRDDSPDGVDRFALVFDDLPAPLGWGRWLEQSEWREASALASTDAVVLTVGWRPGTITINKGGVAQAGVCADFTLRYQTDQGPHEAWWQPAYPYNGLRPRNPNQGDYTPVRDTTEKLGGFKTDAQGRLRRHWPDGTLHPIIFPRGIAALGNREPDRWASGPEPERHLLQARVYHLQEWKEVTEGADVTLDVAACSLTITGPSGACYEAYWEATGESLKGVLTGSPGTKTLTGIPPGEWSVWLRDGSDGSKGLPRQSVTCSTSGGAYSLAFPTSWQTATGRLEGYIYAYGATPAAGVTIWGYVPYGYPNAGSWQPITTTDSSGYYKVPAAIPYLGIVVEDPTYGAARKDDPAIGGSWWDPCLGGRIGGVPTLHDAMMPPGSTSGELYPWGVAGGHANLPAAGKLGYFEDQFGRRYALTRGPTIGHVSEPMPRWNHYSGWRSSAPPAQSAPGAKYTYQLHAMDGTHVGTSYLLLDCYNALWGSDLTWYHAGTDGRIISQALGGKYEGDVLEADRSRVVTATEWQDPFRVGLEFGRWTAPLEHRSWSATAELVLCPTTFADWECPYCGGPAWCEPDGAYRRGCCQQCADHGATTDCRGYLITQSLPSVSDWWNRVVKATGSGVSLDRLIAGYPRPCEYYETDDYVIDPWPEDPGLPRWVARHLTLGVWNNGLFVDGESVAQAEGRLGQTLGPVMLKFRLGGDYAGRGKTLSVTATDVQGESRSLRVTIPPGAKAGDLFPLDWGPHHRFPRGYYTEVTGMAEVSGDGAIYGTVVNDGPSWRSSTGIIVQHQKHSPYATDVALAGRDPFLVEDAAGRLHLVYLREGQVMRRVREYGGGWGEAENVSVRANHLRSSREPSLAPLPHGELVVGATTANRTRLWRSRDEGKRWG